MLDKQKGCALPKGRQEKKYDLINKSDDYSLQQNSAKASMEQKKGLQKNVKDHRVKY